MIITTKLEKKSIKILFNIKQKLKKMEEIIKFIEALISVNTYKLLLSLNLLTFSL